MNSYIQRCKEKGGWLKKQVECSSVLASQLCLSVIIPNSKISLDNEVSLDGCTLGHIHATEYTWTVKQKRNVALKGTNCCQFKSKKAFTFEIIRSTSFKEVTCKWCRYNQNVSSPLAYSLSHPFNYCSVESQGNLFPLPLLSSQITC